MKFLRIPLIVLALVGLIALAGCGDDDSTTSDESTATESSTTATDESTESTTTESDGDALSAEEYSQQAQEVLVTFGTSFQKLGSEISASSSPEEFADLVDEAESEIQTAIDDFSAITPPEEAQEGHDQILAALEDFSSKLTDVSNAAESGDQAALQDAATELQAAGLDFQEQLTQAAKSLSEAGIGVGGSAGG